MTGSHEVGSSILPSSTNQINGLAVDINGIPVGSPKTFPKIAPAYAEVDCANGLYTGYRYRFWSDPIVHHAALYRGTVFYPTSGMIPECIYA